MNITNYWSENYRNLDRFEIHPCEGINIIYGENGQGKTNIIESIWLFTGCNSFRTYRYAELINKGAEKAKVSIEYNSNGYEQFATLDIAATREFTLNGIKKRSSREFLGEFKSVVFSPLSLSVVNGGPSDRRKFLDIAISLIRPVYASDLMRYIKIMQNRNALLKQISLGMTDAQMLEAWDEELAKAGGKVTKSRIEYLEKISDYTGDIYREISGGKEKLSLSYMSPFYEESKDEYEIAEKIYNQLQKSRESDIKRLATSAGPHKDDILINVNNMNIRNFGSQGQQRTAALALKIAEAYIIKNESGDSPVILLDDVMSELDFNRQTCLLKYLSGWQVFVTCCDPTNLSAVKDCKLFKVRNGSIY